MADEETSKDALSPDDPVNTGKEGADRIESVDKGEGVALVCPYCGELNEFPGYSEVFAFTCRRCGKSDAPPHFAYGPL
jgi:hypothetical protein